MSFEAIDDDTGQMTHKARQTSNDHKKGSNIADLVKRHLSICFIPIWAHMPFHATCIKQFGSRSGPTFHAIHLQSDNST